MSRRKLTFWLASCAVAAAVLIGVWYLRLRAAERVATAALDSLETGIDLPCLRSAAEKLDGFRNFASEAELFRAACLLRTASPAEALASLGRVGDKGRLRLPRLLVAGEILYRTGRPSEAERLFRIVVAERPNAIAPHRWLATILHDKGAMYGALSELEQVARLQPDDFFAYRLMGLIYNEDLGRHSEAAENYRKALEQNPPPDQANMIRRECAECLLALNDYSAALEMLETVRDDAHVLALRADCHWSTASADEARRLLAAALELDSHERAALTLSARIAVDEGAPQQAIEPLRTLLADDPHDFQAHYQLSRAYQRLGDKRSAAAELELMKESKALRERLGRLYEQAMARSRDAGIREEIAVLCEKLGKHQLAETWHRAAAECRATAQEMLLPELTGTVADPRHEGR